MVQVYSFKIALDVSELCMAINFTKLIVAPVIFLTVC